jgi:PKD repeat protein
LFISSCKIRDLGFWHLSNISTNQTTTFTGLSANNPTWWVWDFGDGTDASVQNPVHTYMQAGNYTVSFEIANSVGSNITTRVDYISVSNPPVTTIPTTVPTTAVTTTPTTMKPTPTKTHAPLSPLTVIGAISLIGLFVMSRNSEGNKK